MVTKVPRRQSGQSQHQHEQQQFADLFIHSSMLGINGIIADQLIKGLFLYHLSFIL